MGGLLRVHRVPDLQDDPWCGPADPADHEPAPPAARGPHPGSGEC